MSRHTYTGEAIEVVYDPKTCIHAGECVRGNPAVFNPKNKPWVQLEGANPDEVARTVESCPTGALTYRRLDGGSGESAPAANTVLLDDAGPAYLRGAIRIESAEGEVTEATRVALCRCGASSNKPYCDGAHSKAGFTDPGLVGTSNTKAAPEDQSHLQVKVLQNGPLILSGPYEIVDAKGEMCLETGGGSLCRCGASQNKPFCDGQHKQIEFEG